MNENGNIKETLKRDCRLLGDFAVKAVECLKADDSKGLVRMYTGASQANLLTLLTDFVEHLGLAASPEDLPGDCPEARRLRNYSLWAFRGQLEHAGNPADIGTEFVLGAQAFFDGLILQDPFLYRIVSNPVQRRHYLRLLQLALKLNGFLLKDHWAFGLVCKIFGAKEDPEPSRTRDGEWMKRQRETVEREAKRLGRKPQELVDGLWLENEEEWTCAAHFPEMLRGYSSAQSLKKHFYE